jgi:hypothetical protein
VLFRSKRKRSQLLKEQVLDMISLKQKLINSCKLYHYLTALADVVKTDKTTHETR